MRINFVRIQVHVTGHRCVYIICLSKHLNEIVTHASHSLRFELLHSVHVTTLRGIWHSMYDRVPISFVFFICSRKFPLRLRNQLKVIMSLWYLNWNWVLHILWFIILRFTRLTLGLGVSCARYAPDLPRLAASIRLTT